MTMTGGTPVPSSPADTWDAGDMGCGELIMYLSMRLKAMPGEVLKLIARDAGAPEDLPAYCRMTGHKLLLVEPDTCTYWIEARQSRAP
jgi:tRNA 2-thiouridine synthesizing protein A